MKENDIDRTPVAKDIITDCSRCKLELNHIVVRHNKEGIVDRVKCHTCGFEHKYKTVAKKKAKTTDSKELQALVTALCDWKPHKHKREAGYRRALVRHLKRKIEMRVSDEVSHSDGKERCRFDLKLGENVIVEMKKNLSRAGERDRAAGQIKKYSRVWGERGPVILLVCETDDSFYQTPTIQEVARMNSEGRPVFAVAAGKKLKAG